MRCTSVVAFARLASARRAVARAVSSPSVSPGMFYSCTILVPDMDTAAYLLYSYTISYTCYNVQRSKTVHRSTASEQHERCSSQCVQVYWVGSHRGTHAYTRVGFTETVVTSGTRRSMLNRT